MCWTRRVKGGLIKVGRGGVSEGGRGMDCPYAKALGRLC
jgi:hypothetical protein